MGLFGLTNPFDEIIEKATSEDSLGEDWAIILHVCDKINSAENGVRDSLKSIKTRLLNSNQRISNAAVVLLDAAVQNCGTEFRRSVNEKDFTSVLEKICENNGPVSEKLRISISRWIEEYKTDMYQVNAIYYQLQAKGIVFPNNNAQIEVKKAAENNNPDAVSNQQEEDDIAKAIAESLKSEESEKHKTISNNRNNGTLNTTENTKNLYSIDELSRGEPVISETVLKSPPVMRHAKALYDFEADEENEVTFKAGHMIILLDTSHEAWWRGRNTVSGLEGLFPANFVEEIASVRSNSQANTNERESVLQTTGNSEQNNSLNNNSLNNNSESNNNGKTSANDSNKKLIVPLDLERVEQTLANLRVHDPALEEPDMLKFNEKMCEQMIPIITEKVHTLDEKFTDVSNINEKFQNILAAFGNFQQNNMGGHQPHIGIPMGQQSMAQNMGHQNMSQQNMAQQNMAQQNMAQQNMNQPPQQFIQGQSLQQPAQQQVSQQQTSQQPIPQQNGYVNFPSQPMYQYPPPSHQFPPSQ